MQHAVPLMPFTFTGFWRWGLSPWRWACLASWWCRIWRSWLRISVWRCACLFGMLGLTVILGRRPRDPVQKSFDVAVYKAPGWNLKSLYCVAKCRPHAFNVVGGGWGDHGIASKASSSFFYLVVGASGGVDAVCRCAYQSSLNKCKA
jgi:hypothetical protein